MLLKITHTQNEQYLLVGSIYFDAAVVGTLSIASPTHAYAQAIRHEENGYLAADDQWEAVIHQAIDQRPSYARLAAAANQDVQRRFVWSTVAASREMTQVPTID